MRDLSGHLPPTGAFAYNGKGGPPTAKASSEPSFAVGVGYKADTGLFVCSGEGAKYMVLAEVVQRSPHRGGDVRVRGMGTS